MSRSWTERRVAITLLEDLHSGAGVGNAALDALLATDHAGSPMLFWSHLKGVMAERTAEVFDDGKRHRWFGQSSSDQSGAICLTSARSPGDSQLLPHSSTARRPDSRAPRTDTLRTVQYLAAGSQLLACVQLPTDQLDDFGTLLRTVDTLGADRRRGAGVVRIDLGPEEPRNAVPISCPPGQRLRLLLQAIDPVSLPLTSTPTTSLVHGGTFIRGQTLAGALVNAALAQAGEASAVARSIWERQLTVLDALPMPLDLAVDEVLPRLAAASPWPLPEGWRLSKSSAGAEASASPWWCAPAAPTLTRAGGRTPPDDTLLLQARDGEWGWYRPTARYRLRIQVNPGQDPALFAQHELVEDTLFVADLLLPDDAMVCSELQALLGSGRWLRTGRGGRPLRVLGGVPMERPGAPPKGACVLISDAILRDPHTLETIPLLDETRLRTLEPHARRPTLEDGTPWPAAIGVAVSGFNYAARLPRQPVWAIRRGTRLEFDRPPASAALGERQHEGFGQLRALPDLPDAIAARRGAAAVASDISEEERLHCLASTLAVSHADSLTKVSRSNRSGLINALPRFGKAEQVLAAAQTFIEATSARAGLSHLLKELQRREDEWPQHLARLAELIVAFSLTQESTEEQP